MKRAEGVGSLQARLKLRFYFVFRLATLSFNIHSLYNGRYIFKAYQCAVQSYFNSSACT